MSATDARGYNDESRFQMCRAHTSNDVGAWRAVEIGFQEWPKGVVLVQEAYEDYNFREVAELIKMLTKVAEVILRTHMGIMRYLVGAPLYHDAEMVVGSEPRCPGVTRADFFPSMVLPYMLHILGLNGIDLCGPEARSMIKTAASRDQKSAAWIAQLSEQGRYFVKESLKNLRIRTVLQPPRLTKQEEHEETTSTYRTRSCSVDRPDRHPRFSDAPVVSQPVLGSPSSIFPPPPDGDQVASVGGTDTEMGSESTDPRTFSRQQLRGEGSSSSGPSVSTSVGSIRTPPPTLFRISRPFFWVVIDFVSIM
jgi:hypothetical protein